MTLAQGSRILLIIAASLAVSQFGCAFVDSPGSSTPEQAALRVQPPQNGEQRFSISKPAPDGVLVIFENVKNPPRDADQLEAGYAFVTQEWFGWAVHEGGGIGGSPRHGMLVYVTPADDLNKHTILFGKTVDQEVRGVLASFSTGQQMYDPVVNGLFGMTIVPKASLCWLELLDAAGQRIEWFDLRGGGGNLAEFLLGDADPTRQECP